MLGLTDLKIQHVEPQNEKPPSFCFTRLSNMQRSQHAKLLRKNKDSPRCTQLHCLPESVLRSAKTHKSCKNAQDFLTYFCGPQRLTKVANAHIWILLTATVLTLQSAKTYKGTPRIKRTVAVRKDLQKFLKRTAGFGCLQLCLPCSLQRHTWNAIYNARNNRWHPPTSPNTAPATKNESYDWSLSHMRRYLQCAEQQVSLSKLTKYCACHEKWISWLILVTHATLFTMRGATSLIVQTHQILRLPRKMTVMTDPRHIWNALKRYLQCAEQQVASSNITKYCACHAKGLSWLILVTYETLFTMRGTTGRILQHHQILRLPRKMTVMTDPRHIWNAIYNARNNKLHPPTSPTTAPATQNDSPTFQRNFSKTAETSFPMRDRSELDPTMKPSSATRLATEVTFQDHHEHFVLKNTFRAPAIILNFTEYCACHEKWHLNFTKYCACHAKWLSWLILVTYETLFTMRGTTGGILQHHQILRLPRKMTVMTDPRHIWNAIYKARNNRWHPPTSPNTAPATQNDCHDWSSSQMKLYLQCAEQQVSLSKLTNTAPATQNYSPTFQRNLIFRKQLKRHFQCGADPRMIRAGSENDPRMIRPWNRHSATRLATEVTFHAHHEHFVLKITTFRAPAIIPNFTEYCACHEKWQFNITKYCACHEKRISWLILVTHETLFTMRGATSVIVQTHQILHLPRKMTLMINPLHTWNAIYNARSNKCHCPNSPNILLPRKVTLRYSTLLYIRYYSLTNLYSTLESNLLQISSQTNLISSESLLKRI